MTPSILVVDDDKIFYQSIVSILVEANSYDDKWFLYAKNGKEALQLMDKVEVDMILLDLQMPVMNGFQFLERFKEIEKFKGIPIIAISGVENKNEIMYALTLGVDSYFIKPIIDNNLLIMSWKVKSLLKNRMEHKKISQVLKLDKERGINNDTIFEEINYLIDELKNRNNTVKEYTTNVETLMSRKEEEIQVKTYSIEQEAVERSKLLTEATHEIRTPLHIINSHIIKSIEWLRPLSDIFISATELLTKCSRCKTKNLDEKRTLPDCSECRDIHYKEGLLSKVEVISKVINRLSSVHDNAQHLKYIVNDLLDLSELSSIKQIENIIPFNLDNLIHNIIEECKLYYLIDNKNKKKKDVNIIVNTNVSVVISDEKRVRSIITNLVSNAMKYTKQGKIIISSSREGHYFCLSVKDTGIGISDEHKQNIFETFYKVDFGSEEDIRSTGLGLSIVKKTTELLGGDIKFISHFGTGSHFIVRLPNLSEQIPNIN